MFDLLAKNDSLFYVIAYWALDNDIIAKGWIHKESHLGIFLLHTIRILCYIKNLIHEAK